MAIEMIVMNFEIVEVLMSRVMLREIFVCWRKLLLGGVELVKSNWSILRVSFGGEVGWSYCGVVIVWMEMVMRSIERRKNKRVR